MTNQLGTVTPTAPFLYALVGTVLLAIGGMLFVNLNEDPEIFMIFTVVFTGPALYFSSLGPSPAGPHWPVADSEPGPQVLLVAADLSSASAALVKL